MRGGRRPQHLSAAVLWQACPACLSARRAGGAASGAGGEGEERKKKKPSERETPNNVGTTHTFRGSLQPCLAFSTLEAASQEIPAVPTVTRQAFSGWPCNEHRETLQTPESQQGSGDPGGILNWEPSRASFYLAGHFWPSTPPPSQTRQTLEAFLSETASKALTYQV